MVSSRNVTAQTRLVEDLLDLSRITTGNVRLSFERVDLKATIENALEAVRPAARVKNITIVATLGELPGTVEAAPDRLQQVIWNLLMNSVKFTPAGGRIDLTCEVRGEGVAIIVRDTGQGIAREALPYYSRRFAKKIARARVPRAG